MRLLHQIFKATGASKVFYGYLAYFIAVAVIIWLIEPSITRFGDSLWYCFAVATTVGFGDFTALTTPGRVITVILSVYSVAVLAVFTAVITGYFTEVVKNNAEQSAARFLDELERLPELTPDELRELSKRVSRFRKTLN